MSQRDAAKEKAGRVFGKFFSTLPEPSTDEHHLVQDQTQEAVQDDIQPIVQVQAQDKSQEAMRHLIQEPIQDIVQEEAQEPLTILVQVQTQDAVQDVTAKAARGYIATQGRKGMKKPRVNLAIDSPAFFEAIRTRTKRDNKTLSQLINEAIAFYLTHKE
jgi:hypothetical protein